MKNLENKKICVLLAILLAVGLLFVCYFHFIQNKSVPLNNQLDQLAKCLNQNGAVMYGAYWCPHCQNQKKLFGNAFKYVNYIECAENPGKCSAAGIQEFPTWVFPAGDRLVGEQTLETLAEKSQCSFVTEKSPQ